MISEERLRKVLNDIETAQKGGLLSQQAGTRLYPEEVEGGYYMSPPILTECHDDMASFRNEILVLLCLFYTSQMTQKPFSVPIMLITGMVQHHHARS